MTKELGRKLRELRTEKGYTQTFVGQKLNIGNKTISDYEHGISGPDSTTLKDFAKLYNVSLDEILGTSKKPLMKIFNSHYMVMNPN